MRKKKSSKGFKAVLADTFKGFITDKVPTLSGSLAFSTVFSMGPLLIVLISLCSLFLGREATEGKIYAQLAGFLGHDAAIQLQQMIGNAFVNGKSGIAIVIGIITLLIGATAVFAEIQDSINSIWGIRAKPKKGWLKILQNRLLSFSVIVGLGFILLVSLTVSSLIDGFNNRLQVHFPHTSIVVFYIVNSIISFAIISLIFAVIFKVLPDAVIKWKDVFVGAFVTAFLFMMGKFGISFYISKSSIGTTYGAAGSLVILLLWVYYSAIVLYLGAEFTKAWAVKYGDPIHPNSYAVTVKQVETVTNAPTIRANEKEH